MNRAPTSRLTSTDGEKMNLAGSKVVQIRFASGGFAVRFILSSENKPLSEFAIEEAITLTRNYDPLVLTGAKPGPSYNPRELAPLLDLLKERIEQVEVRPGCQLTLTFSNGWTLAVAETEFEEPGWTLRHGPFISLI